MLKEFTKCPVCESNQIIKGIQKGIYARIYPLNSKIYVGGSDIISDICKSCGSIFNTKVENLDKFKK